MAVVEPDMDSFPLLRPDHIPLLSLDWLQRAQTELAPLIDALAAEVRPFASVWSGGAHRCVAPPIWAPGMCALFLGGLSQSPHMSPPQKANPTPKTAPIPI